MCVCESERVREGGREGAVISHGSFRRGRWQLDDDLRGSHRCDQGLRAGFGAELRRRVCADRVYLVGRAHPYWDAYVGRLPQGHVRGLPRSPSCPCPRDVQGWYLLARRRRPIAGFSGPV